MLGLNPLETAILAVALGGYVIVRQLLTRRVSARGLLAIPLALGVVGLRDLAGLSDPALVGIFLASAGLDAIMGALRGLTFRVWTDAASAVWMRGTPLTLALWLLFAALRAAMAAAAISLGASSGSTMGAIPVLLAITFGAQNLVIWLRSQERGLAVA